MEADLQSRSIDIEGRRLGVRQTGVGRPLLLINGYAATAADWDPSFLAELARTFAVICPDNRGVGNSELGDPRALTVDGMAEDLEALLDILELGSLPVAGWSMGGFVAQRLAARAPERVEALVLLSTDPGGTASIPAEAETWDRLTDLSGAPREQATRLISVLFPPEIATQIDRRFGEAVAAARATLSPEALLAQEAAMAGWHGEDRSPPTGTPHPTLIACGSEDVVIPPANAEALAARSRDCRVERFAGGGHAFMAQEPQRLADLIVSFLRDSASP